MSLLGLLYALSAEFLFLAYDYLSPGIASTIFFSYPIIVALVLILFYKEKLTLPTLLSLLLVVAGVGVLSIKKGEALNYIGLGISLLGALVYALYILIVNKILRSEDFLLLHAFFLPLLLGQVPSSEGKHHHFLLGISRRSDLICHYHHFPIFGNLSLCCSLYRFHSYSYYGSF